MSTGDFVALAVVALVCIFFNLPLWWGALLIILAALWLRACKGGRDE